jgi:uncharacterized protein YyaL (SSP411 family)
MFARQSPRKTIMPNHLAQSQSLYLRKHAENPIDWWPWCDLAIEMARSQDKPIFLSIGYSSCHWCTVMEGEAFSDTPIADYMKAHFIAIKVDREERPDLDSIYMQAVQIMGESGGWPLNLFLTPDDLVPFYGGTYFPIEPRYGRPGFLRVLQSIHQIYQEKRQELQDYKEQIVNNLNLVTQVAPAASIDGQTLVSGIAKCAQVLVNRETGTCFPMIPYADLVLRCSQFQPDLRSRAEQRGIDLGLGGIYDHVAGGWHRYTVDPTWTVPHFEKMLYDNGQIVEFLANLWSSGVREPALERAIAQTSIWLQREMLTAEGYFYASQDADSEGKEGKFWVWSYNELKKLFTEVELSHLTQEFTVTPNGNFEGQNVLRRRQTGKLSSASEACLSGLFRKRYGEYSVPTDAFPPARSSEQVKTINWPGRVPPVTDTKMIVAWNALMISGLARAYQVFGVEADRQLAIAAADFILQNQWVGNSKAFEGKRLFRVSYDGNPAVVAQSEDYALLIKALIDLHQACLDINVETHLADTYLDKALEIQAEFDRAFGDEIASGYFNTAVDSSDRLLIREKSYQDNAIPSANGIAITNLVRLGLLADRLDYLSKAEITLNSFGQVISNSPVACPSLISAAVWLANYTLVRTTVAQYQQLKQQYLPFVVFKIEPDLPSSDVLAIVCQGFTCLGPATSTEQLQQQLATSQARSHL